MIIDKNMEKNPELLISYVNGAKNKKADIGPFEVREKYENYPQENIHNAYWWTSQFSV